MRRRKEDENHFNAASYRRSAVMLNDDDIMAGGVRPRPPPSMEQQDRPVTFGTMYGAPGAAYSQQSPGAPHSPYQGYYNNYAQQQQQRIDDYRNQYMEANHASGPPSANSANPFFTPAPYAQSPFSPMASPVASSSPINNHAPAVSAVLTRNSASSSAATLSRQTTSNTVNIESDGQDVTYGDASADPTRFNTAPPSGDYIDLNRSSVTPFQAAQYVEISKRLNTEMPQGLSTPAVDAAMQGIAEDEDDESPPPLPEKDNHRASFVSQTEAHHDFDFPAPPSPSFTPASRYRVDSTPPILPEIRVQSRGNSYDFTPIDSQFPSGFSAAAHGSGDAQILTLAPRSAFPVSPSPLASSFTFSPGPEQKGFDSGPIPRPAVSAAEAVRRPETVYDPEDAYGGI